MIARMVTLMLQWARKHPCLILALAACAGIILAEQGAQGPKYGAQISTAHLTRDSQ